MSRSLAMSGKAMATKSLKEKWLSMVQLVRENGENGIGGSSTVTAGRERGKVCVGGTGCSHVAFLSAAETAPFFETSFPLLRCELAGPVL